MKGVGNSMSGEQGTLLPGSCGAQSNAGGKKGFLKHPVVFNSVPSG